MDFLFVNTGNAECYNRNPQNNNNNNNNDKVVM